jgi:MoaA/NifB/PqqE/SkfB family radical SAM enzyme
MKLALGSRMLREVSPRLLWKFAYTFGWKGMRAVDKFKKRVEKGEYFPAFLFFSMTGACNLSCQGCWVKTDDPASLSLEQMEKVIQTAKSKGSHFFGLLGGEPFMHKDLFELIGRHPDCYFQIFTNGTLITREIAQTMRKLGNVTPLISIEGLEAVSDIRRGGSQVFERTMAGLAHCREAKLVIGIATSACQSNYNDLVSDEFVHRVIDAGAHYLWYYIYRPVGPRPTPELSLTEEQILNLRQFMVDARCRHKIAIVDAYWNAKGEALCPASTGISYHIGPGGAIEPCPVVQFSDANIDDSDDLTSLICTSQFLDDFRQLTQRLTRGCILLDAPAELKGYLDNHPDVIDSSGRECALDELAAMEIMPGHHNPGKEIPEKSWAYRFAKKHWFFGFGAYG